MATSIQQIVDRATAWAVANGGTSLVADVPSIIARVAADERELFHRASLVNSFYYATTAAVASTSGSGGRTLDLETVNVGSQPVIRLLRVRLPSGTDVSQVDLRYQNEELAPRYFLRGKSIVEVGSDWGTAGAVTLTLDYVRGPATLNTGGTFAQNVSLDDRFCDILEMKLAWFLAHGDEGRNVQEITRLQQLIAERVEMFENLIASYGSAMSTAFTPPTIRQSE